MQGNMKAKIKPRNLIRHPNYPVAFLIAIGMVVLACGIPPGFGGAGIPPTDTATIAEEATSITASAATIMPILITPLPPDYTPPPASVSPTLTLIPTLQDGLGPTELKYRLLDQFPDLFFCDPDYYPVARADETDLARQHFSELQANPEEFNTILAHNQMDAQPTYTDEQKLLIYREHKKLAAVLFELAGNSYQFNLQVAESKGQGELITGAIDGQGKISVQQRKPTIATCPICLTEGTLIDTPSGWQAVQNLQAGMLVWTEDGNGARTAKPVLRIGKTVVPSSHKVIHLVLDDGRELSVSPGHPTVGGRGVGQLQVGDQLDGGIIRSIRWVRYTGYATYDLLPAGETGFYWANGILLASTLKDGLKR
jgi:hypothetical protein